MQFIDDIRSLVQLAEFQQNRSRKLYRDISDLYVKIALIKDACTHSKSTIVLDSTFSWIEYFLGEIELELEILETHTTYLQNWLQRRITQDSGEVIPNP